MKPPSQLNDKESLSLCSTNNSLINKYFCDKVLHGLMIHVACYFLLFWTTTKPLVFNSQREILLKQQSVLVPFIYSFTYKDQNQLTIPFQATRAMRKTPNLLNLKVLIIILRLQPFYCKEDSQSCSLLPLFLDRDYRPIMHSSKSIMRTP